MARTAVTIIVTGRVQGVGFRAFVRRRATELGLDGWVRNRRDGSVEITAIGDAERIDQLVVRCQRGPALARVANVTRREIADDGSIGFREQPNF